MSYTPTTELRVMRGDTVRYNVRVTDSDGAAVDLTGASAWFTVKRSRRDADADKIFQKTIGNGITVTDAADGRLLLTLDATDLAALSILRVYVWDLQVKLSTGDIITADYLTGALIAEGDVTRATS